MKIADIILAIALNTTGECTTAEIAWTDRASNVANVSTVDPKCKADVIPVNWYSNETRDDSMSYAILAHDPMSLNWDMVHDTRTDIASAVLLWGFADVKGCN